MANVKFHCKMASIIDEATKLIEAGFDYMTTFNGVMLFKSGSKNIEI
ncbi:hypothetical protein KEJ27_02995 [Candidatus Bathyarchaeota archaeon]|nr:hypothetical protein [Candidatus Bathyarchaeota archaeon]MBS7613906.1 hypothetical protein [Candidatus Bathyarchaeota archaeon]